MALESALVSKVSPPASLVLNQRFNELHALADVALARLGEHSLEAWLVVCHRAFALVRDLIFVTVLSLRDTFLELKVNLVVVPLCDIGKRLVFVFVLCIFFTPVIQLLPDMLWLQLVEVLIVTLVLFTIINLLLLSLTFDHLAVFRCTSALFIVALTATLRTAAGAFGRLVGLTGVLRAPILIGAAARISITSVAVVAVDLRVEERLHRGCLVDGANTRGVIDRVVVPRCLKGH